MDRPLWQILFAMSLLAVAVARAGTAIVLADSTVAPGIAVAHGIQSIAALLAAAVIWLRREWTVAAFLGMALVVAASLYVPRAIA